VQLLLTMHAMKMTMILDRLHTNELDITTVVLAERQIQRKIVRGGMIASLEDRGTTTTKTATCRTEGRRDQGLPLRKNHAGLRIGERKTEIAIRAVLSIVLLGHIAIEMRFRTKQTMTWTATMQSRSQPEKLSIMTAEAVAGIGIETGITIRADLAATTRKNAKTRNETGGSDHGESVRTGVLLTKLKRSLDIDHAGISESTATATMRNLSMGARAARGVLPLRRQSSRKRTCIR
jgi:hypothetical protein